MKTKHLLTSLLWLILLANISLAQTPSVNAVNYITPSFGSVNISPATTIAIRPKSSQSLFSLQVEGSTSGRVNGEVRLSDDNQTFVFIPEEEFALRETVSIYGRCGDQSFTSHFTIADHTFRLTHEQQLNIFFASEYPQKGDAWNASVPLDTIPSDLPAIKVTQNNSPANGKIFLANFTAPWNPPVINYLLILNEDGSPSFYRKRPAPCFDFKVQPDGRLTYFEAARGRFYAMDSNYVIVDSFMAGNGYGTDLHELIILPNGHALLIANTGFPADMSKVIEGGNPKAYTLEMIVQELDLAKNVVFEWRSWEHYKFTDATDFNLKDSIIDYVHSNAIEPDSDGNLLLSNRHTDDVAKINRTTGELMWRWGGENNSFTFINDTLQFNHQHTVRRLNNGNILLYDNGNLHKPTFSRAVEYRVDEVKKTAELIWQYRNTPDYYGPAMGIAQRLSNGNTFIGWGGIWNSGVAATEVSQDGTKLFEFELPQWQVSYRIFRFPWEPTVKSTVAANSLSTSSIVSYPNPAKDFVTIGLKNEVGEVYKAELIDMTGRFTISLSLLRQSEGQVTLDLTGVLPGTYFCRIFTAREVLMERLLVTE